MCRFFSWKEPSKFSKEQDSGQAPSEEGVGSLSQLKSENGWKWCFFKGCIFMPRFSIQTDKWLFPFMESWDLPAKMSLNSG